MCICKSSTLKLNVIFSVPFGSDGRQLGAEFAVFCDFNEFVRSGTRADVSFCVLREVIVSGALSECAQLCFLAAVFINSFVFFVALRARC